MKKKTKDQPGTSFVGLVGANLPIYRDPFGMTTEEGRATVISVVSEHVVPGGVSYADCWVKFDGEDEQVFRTIAHI